MKKGIGTKIWEIFERFVLFCLRLILKPIKKTLTPAQEQAFMQFVKFALVGVTNTFMSTFINWGTLWILDSIGGFEGVEEIGGGEAAASTSISVIRLLSSSRYSGPICSTASSYSKRRNQARRESGGRLFSRHMLHMHSRDLVSATS